MQVQLSILSRAQLARLSTVEQESCVRQRENLSNTLRLGVLPLHWHMLACLQVIKKYKKENTPLTIHASVITVLKWSSYHQYRCGAPPVQAVWPLWYGGWVAESGKEDHSGGTRGREGGRGRGGEAWTFSCPREREGGMERESTLRLGHTWEQGWELARSWCWALHLRLGCVLSFNLLVALSYWAVILS